jgi:hypothetical protein
MHDYNRAAETPAANITLLDYFAARAPKEIPAWYMENFFPYEGPARPVIPADASENDRTMLESWCKDGIFDLPPEWSWFADKMNAYNEGLREHQEDFEIYRYFEWPWYWANRMLMSRYNHNVSKAKRDAAGT